MPSGASQLDERSRLLRHLLRVRGWEDTGYGYVHDALAQFCIEFLGTRWGAVDFNEPDLQLLVHHEVKAEELEALVREVFWC